MSVPKPPKTSKELANAVEDEWKRQVIDDAKHRAVRQHEDYETFKNMVSVAHLRPLQAMNTKDHKTAAPAWSFNNAGTIERQAEAGGAPIGGSQGVPSKPPENAMEFEKTWRRNCRTTADRYQYLCMIPDEKVAALFKVEISGTMLGEVMIALSEAFAAEEDKSGRAGRVASLLQTLTRSGRFSLTVRLLAGKPKNAAEALFVELEAAGADVAAIKHAYGVK